MDPIEHLLPVYIRALPTGHSQRDYGSKRLFQVGQAATKRSKRLFPHRRLPHGQEPCALARPGPQLVTSRTFGPQVGQNQLDGVCIGFVSGPLESGPRLDLELTLRPLAVPRRLSGAVMRAHGRWLRHLPCMCGPKHWRQGICRGTHQTRSGLFLPWLARSLSLVWWEGGIAP